MAEDTNAGAAAATAATATTAATAATAAAATTQQQQTTTTAADVKPTWPDNWRNEMVGGDEKELQQIGRYATPADVWKKARALEQRLSSGEFKRTVPFPDKGTPEEQASWRKEAGIPEAPDKYELPKGKDGKPVYDPAKPEVANFLKAAHAANMAPQHVQATLQFLAQEAQRQDDEDRQQDEQEQKAYEDTQRAKWGQDYRRNENLIGGLLDTAPQGVKDLLLKSRLADGTLLKNHPGVQDFLIGLALQINPQGTVVPNSSGNIGVAIDDEIAKIEKVMRENRKEYNRDEKMQARYRDLIAARQRTPKAA